MSAGEEKKALRRELARLEKSLSAEYKAAADERITDNLLSLEEYRKAKTVFIFAGFGCEIDTGAIMRDILDTGRRLAVPLCIAPGIMIPKEIKSPGILLPGSFGIPEPSADVPEVDTQSIDLAVIPCLSCDRRGNRLGRGGGYYDRFLEKYTGKSVLLCREALVTDSIPTEAHDVSVPVVVTDGGIFRTEEQSVIRSYPSI